MKEITFNQKRALEVLKFKLKITNEDIAHQCGVSVPAVSNWRKSHMRFKDAIALCAANSISIEQFIKFGEE